MIYILIADAVDLYIIQCVHISWWDIGVINKITAWQQNTPKLSHAEYLIKSCMIHNANLLWLWTLKLSYWKKVMTAGKIGMSNLKFSANKCFLVMLIMWFFIFIKIWLLAISWTLFIKSTTVTSTGFYMNITIFMNSFTYYSISCLNFSSNIDFKLWQWCRLSF